MGELSELFSQKIDIGTIKSFHNQNVKSHGI